MPPKITTLPHSEYLRFFLSCFNKNCTKFSTQQIFAAFCDVLIKNCTKLSAHCTQRIFAAFVSCFYKKKALNSPNSKYLRLFCRAVIKNCTRIRTQRIFEAFVSCFNDKVPFYCIIVYRSLNYNWITIRYSLIQTLLMTTLLCFLSKI